MREIDRLCVLLFAWGLATACSSNKPAPSTTGDSTKPAGDGGSTPAPAPTTPTPAPPSVGWRAAVGAGGVIVQTFDDRDWATRNTGARDLFGVACVGNDLGWAAGEGGVIGHTTDGGLTWQPQASGVTSALRAIRFGATTFGVAVGDAGAIVVTHDGGASWTRVTSGTTEVLRAVAVARDRGLAFVVGDGDTVLRSEDSGASFRSVQLVGAANLRGVAADDGAHMIVLVDDAGGIFASSDGGSSFTREATAPAALHGVALDSHGALALAVGESGLVMERGAYSWTRVESGTGKSLRAALVPDGGSVDYVAGEGGTLLARPRGQSAWHAIPTGTNATLFALEDL